MSELEALLTRSGPITFDRYLQLVLYHPVHGYYANRVPGRGVSYETSASIGPEFGEMVAVELRAMWEALGRPDPFTVTEFGAGLAGLAEGAIRSAGPLLQALHWRIVEQFDSVARMQREQVGPAARHVEWISSLEGPTDRWLRPGERGARQLPVPSIPQNRRQDSGSLRRLEG